MQNSPTTYTNPNANLQTAGFSGASAGTVVPGSNTPIPQPTTPTVDPQAGYKDAFNAYIQSLTPSADETTARDNLNKLMTQDRLDYEKALNSGDTLGYATGLAGQQARTAGIMEGGASSALDAITGQRTATSDAQKARVDFEKSLIPSTPDSKPFQSGDNTYQYNPTTQTYDVVSTKAAAPVSQPASVQEYEYAKANGYKGTFTDYQNADANRKRSIAQPTATQTSAAEQKASQGKLATYLSGLTGKDGYVAPTDYKAAKAAWITDGYSGKDFDAIFGLYVNPSHSEDYIQ